MKISSLIIGMLLVGAVVVSLYAFVDGLAAPQHYNVEINTSYSEAYDKVSDLENNTLELQKKIMEVSKKEDAGFFTGTWDVFDITKDIVLGAVGTTFSGISTATLMATSLLVDIGVAGNSTIVTVVVTILTLLVLGALMFMLTKRKW